MSDITKFDPAKAVDAIRDKIRGLMLDIIPAEQWDALIKAEMKAFMTDTVKKDYSREWVEPAAFKRIVREILNETAKEEIKKVLTSSEWLERRTFNSQNTSELEASEVLKKYIVEAGPQILKECMNDLIARSIQQVITNMKNSNML